MEPAALNYQAVHQLLVTIHFSQNKADASAAESQLQEVDPVQYAQIVVQLSNDADVLKEVTICGIIFLKNQILKSINKDKE